MSPDYSNTMFYKLCCKDVDITEIYVGHNTNWNRRQSQHKSACNNINDKSHKFYVYRYIRDHGGWDNWEMILIARESCADILEAKMRERYYMETLHSTLNKSKPGRTKQEWYIDNRETINQQKASRVICCCGLESNKNHIARHMKSKQHRRMLEVTSVQSTDSTYEASSENEEGC